MESIKEKIINYQNSYSLSKIMTYIDRGVRPLDRVSAFFESYNYDFYEAISNVVSNKNAFFVSLLNSINLIKSREIYHKVSYALNENKTFEVVVDNKINLMVENFSINNNFLYEAKCIVIINNKNVINLDIYESILLTHFLLFLLKDIIYEKERKFEDKKAISVLESINFH